MIQIDMPMPERCGECRFEHIGLMACTIVRKSTSHSESMKPLDRTKRPAWCPLEEV